MSLAVCAALWVGAGTTGIISGVVTNAGNGAKLSGVNVIINGTNLSTVTDDAGRFVITNVPPGEYEVSVELVGFATKVIADVSVTMDRTIKVDADLEEEATQEETVVVTRPRPMVAADAVNTLNLLTAHQEPLTRLDPASIRSAQGMLSALPGVIVETDGSGQMHVRGGRPDQTGWYLEGIPITDPNTGMFGTNLYTTGVSRFQAYTGGFGAEFGNAISGVLNEVKKTGADAAGVGMNIEYGSEDYWSGFAEVGGGSADQFNYYVGTALQRSDLDGPIVKRQEYTDTVAKLVWPSRDNTFTVLAMRGSLFGQLDAYHTTGDNNLPTPNERDFMDQRYTVTAFTWSRSFSPESFITVRPYYMQTDIAQNLVGAYGIYANVSSARTGLQVNYTNQLNDRHLFKLGGSMLRSDNNFYLHPGFPFYRADVDTSQADMFVEDQVKVTDKWTINAGLRHEGITYDRKGNAYVAGQGYSGAPLDDVSESRTTPRLGVSYAADDRTVWKMSWGKYTKFVPSSSVQRTYFDPDLVLAPGFPPLEMMTSSIGATAPQGSTAWEMSWEKQVSQSTALRATPFYTKYTNLGDLYMDPNTGVTTYANLGEGRSKGLELQARKRMSDNWQGWVSYTYQKTESNRADLGLVSNMYPVQWDQRHTLSLVADYRIGRCAHNLRTDLGSGRADRGNPALQQRANPYLIMNYGLTLKLPEGSSLGDSLHLSVYNLLNNRQTMQYSWGAGAVRTRDSWVPSRFVSLGVSSAF